LREIIFQSMRQPCINPISVDSSTFTNTPHPQRQSPHPLYINLKRTRTFTLPQRFTLPQLLPITKHNKLNLRAVFIKLIINSYKRCEAVVSHIQLKLDFRIGRHADALFKRPSANRESTAVEVSIQLRLSPARRQTHRIEIGKKHLRRLDLFQRERE